MIDLAAHAGEGPVSTADIARRQGISPKYLKQLVPPLKAAGLVRSVRGPKGGLVLAKPASDITVMDVVQATEGSIAPVECVDDADICPRGPSCAARGIWTRAREAMEGVLRTASVADLSRHDGQEEA